MTEDKSIAPLIPPVGEDDPLKDIPRYRLGGKQRNLLIPDADGSLLTIGDARAALAITRQQTHDEVEKACAAERAEIALDIAENPNNEWTKELRTLHAEQIAEKDREIAFKDSLIWTSRESELYKATVAAEKAQKEAESREAALRAELAAERLEVIAAIARKEAAMREAATLRAELERLREANTALVVGVAAMGSRLKAAQAEIRSLKDDLLTIGEQKAALLVELRKRGAEIETLKQEQGK